MPRMKQTDKLATLLEERRQLDNQIKDAEAKARIQARKDDDHRKIVAGSLALEHYHKNPDSEFGKVLLRLLDEYTRPRERALFPFLPAPTTSAENATIGQNPENRRDALPTPPDAPADFRYQEAGE